MTTHTAIAHLAAPVCFNPGAFAPLFESLLAWAWWARRQEVLVQQLSIPVGERIDFAAVLPLEYCEGVAVASSMMYATEHVQYADFWTKHWHDVDDDLVDFDKDKAKVNVQRGECKSFKVLLQLHALASVSWTFHSPDVAAVRALLDGIPAVGKKTSAGHGQVRSWEIIETPAAPIIRPIPVCIAGTEDGELAVCGWRPPVWDTDNQELCIIKNYGA